MDGHVDDEFMDRSRISTKEEHNFSWHHSYFNLDAYCFHMMDFIVNRHQGMELDVQYIPFGCRYYVSLWMLVLMIQFNKFLWKGKEVAV